MCDRHSFKALSPFSNVCTDWLYTLSYYTVEENQLRFHIIIHWQSCALYSFGFFSKAQPYFKSKIPASKSIPYVFLIAELYLVLIQWLAVYAIFVLCWGLRCLSTLWSYTQLWKYAEIYCTSIHCRAIPNPNTSRRYI